MSKDILREYEAEAETIKKALQVWRGLTLKECQSKGWTDKQDKLQAKLWELGYKISDLKYKMKEAGLI